MYCQQYYIALRKHIDYALTLNYYLPDAVLTNLWHHPAHSREFFKLVYGLKNSLSK